MRARNILLVTMMIIVTVFLFVAMPSVTEPISEAEDASEGNSKNDRDRDDTSATIPPLKLDELPNIAPLIDNGTHLLVVFNTSTEPVEYLPVSELESGNFRMAPTVQRVFVEVGTNDEPELGPLLPLYRDAMLIGFEPQPEVFRTMIARFPWKRRIIAIPGAITPAGGFAKMHISEHKGCSSMLNMNTRAKNFADKHGKKAPRKSAVIQLRTIKYCASVSGIIAVPSFPLFSILSRVPERVSIDLVMIDAQGFDTSVVSTIGAVANRTKFIILECQDLDPGHTLFLVDGAPSCDQQRRCVEGALPHRLEHCWDNAPKVREYNCLYRLPSVPITDMPKGIKWVSQPRTILYPTQVPFTCPTFL